MPKDHVVQKTYNVIQHYNAMTEDMTHESSAGDSDGSVT